MDTSRTSRVLLSLLQYQALFALIFGLQACERSKKFKIEDTNSVVTKILANDIASQANVMVDNPTGSRERADSNLPPMLLVKVGDPDRLLGQASVCVVKLSDSSQQPTDEQMQLCQSPNPDLTPESDVRVVTLEGPKDRVWSSQSQELTRGLYWYRLMYSTCSVGKTSEKVGQIRIMGGANGIVDGVTKRDFDLPEFSMDTTSDDDDDQVAAEPDPCGIKPQPPVGLQ